MAGYLRRVAIAGTRPWAQPGGLRQAVVAGTISLVGSDSAMMPPVSPAVTMSQEGTTSPTPNAPEMVRRASPSPSRPQPAQLSHPQPPQPGPVHASTESRLDVIPSPAIEQEHVPPTGEPAGAPLVHAPPAPMPPALDVREPRVPAAPGVAEPLAPSVPEISAPPTPR